MKFAAVYTNVNGFHYEAYHFGLASIVSMARQAGHDVTVSTIETAEEIPGVIDEIVAYAPKVIGFTTVSSQYHFVKEIAAELKKRLPDCIVVAGGVHPTISPNALLETDDIDVFFIGESEFSFVEFLEKVEAGEDYRGVENLAYKLDGKVHKNPNKPLIDNLDVIPYPDREVYPYAETLKKVGYAPFFFSRGCPFLCTYCANHALAMVYGKKTNPVRDRSPESCIQEIEFVLDRYGIDAISIEDDVFGINKKWRREFLSLYKERIQPRGVKFMCLLRVELAKEDFIAELKEAGCTQIFFGVESGDEEIRTVMMARRMSNQVIIDAFDLCRKYGIDTLAVNIIGMPGESKQQIKNTIKLNRRIKPTVSAVNIFYPYRGTILGDRCFNDGLVDMERFETFSKERRDSVLNFPASHRRMLQRYHRDWQLLVNPYDLKGWIIWALRRVGLFETVRTIKHSAESLWVADHTGELKQRTLKTGA
jgi:anaerobic magnesium-protoporphyrin IX monomethyl ester cyclase